MKNIIKRTLTFLSTTKTGGAYMLLVLLVLAVSINANAQTETKSFWVQGWTQFGSGKLNLPNSGSKTGTAKDGDFSFTFTSTNYIVVDYYVYHRFQIYSSADITIKIDAPAYINIKHVKVWRFNTRGGTASSTDEQTVYFDGDVSGNSCTIKAPTKNGDVRIETIDITYEKVLTGKGTKDSPYLISSPETWSLFAKKVNGGETNVDAKLTNDINLGSGTYSDMLGTADKPYTGVFDGQGHLITVNYTTSSGGQENVAPFRYVSGATIKYLRTSGTFNVGRKFAAGIVARVKGSCTLEMSESDVKITTSVSGDATAGGLIADADGNVTIKDCAFYGSITGKNATKCGGFIAWPNNAATITNCLQAGTFSLQSTDGSATFARNPSKVTVTNSFYRNSSLLGAAQGTLASDDDLKNGVITKELQAGRTDRSYWVLSFNHTLPQIRRSWYNYKNLLFYKTERQWWCCEELHFTDGTYIPFGIDFVATQIYYNRNLKYGENGIYTVCLPYDYKFNKENFVAYTFSSWNAAKKSVGFKEISENVLEANKPYIIVPKKDLSGFTVTSWRSDIKAEPKQQPSSADCTLEAVITGMSNDQAAKENYYVLQSDGLWHPITTANTNGYIPPYRAALRLKNATGAKSNIGMTFDDDNTATGINAIELENNDGTVRYYNLRGEFIGTSLDNVPSGIYIGNGKKILKK